MDKLPLVLYDGLEGDEQYVLKLDGIGQALPGRSGIFMGDEVEHMLLSILFTITLNSPGQTGISSRANTINIVLKKKRMRVWYGLE
jgi:hypothetical protein